MATLRSSYPGFWETGRGSFALVCQSAHRITFVETEELVRAMAYSNCCRDCDRKAVKHRGFRITPEPAPGSKVSASWKAMVADERT